MVMERLDELLKGLDVSTKSIEVMVERTVAAAADYLAEDVISNLATAGGTPWKFTNVCRAPKFSGTITKAIVLCSVTALTPRLTLYLFNRPPTSELDDNDANTAVINRDRDAYQGRIDLPAMEDLGGNSEAIATPNTSGNVPLEIAVHPDLNELDGILVTRDAITAEVAGMIVAIKLFIRVD